MSKEIDAHRAERSREPPSRRVVSAVAAAANVQPSTLPPLYESIDPDALDALLQTDRTTQTSPSMTFRYYGYEITVRSDGDVTVAEAS